MSMEKNEQKKQKKIVKKSTKSKKTQLEMTAETCKSMSEKLNKVVSAMDEGQLLENAKDIRDIVQSMTRLYKLEDSLRDKA